MTHDAHTSFTFEATTTPEIIRLYNADKKNPSTDSAYRTALESALNKRLKVVEVMPEDTAILEQLVDKDRVHTFGAESVDALRTYRIGGSNTTKTAYALVYMENGQPQVLSAIYAKRIITEDEYPTYIPALLNEKPAAFGPNTDIEMQVYYSISNMGILIGAGERLIQGMLDLPHQSSTLHTTISPLRTLQEATPFLEHLTQTTPVRKRRAAAVAHLLSGTADPVERFHLGNGARLGRIVVDANTPESEDGQKGANIMVQWVYGRAADTAIRAANAEKFRQGAFLDLIQPGLFPREADRAKTIWRNAKTAEHTPRRR